MFGRMRRGSVEKGGLIRCPRCERWLSVDTFGRVRGRAGTGRQSWCKPCCSKDTPLLSAKRAARRDVPGWRSKDCARLKAAYRAKPEQAWRRKQERRARLADVPTERISRNRVYFMWMGLCGICWDFVNPQHWHLDHIVPIAKGGAHVYSNVQPAHPFCNLSKGARVV